eukprot:gnl/TRDRNA2_/TRDRNA2_188445_c0_seq1.p1 gnl/TRDRNA2_/TRDRNA2_188445_c0~~gnl/TRDRNA2_/TRDRNA2_188445_c0_seq1.p1  ORF type:complete len:375 (+),score=58.56 gnl/TRDRNA2_/TRDRNA2_188445_c0_seq1:51-1175(+)
MPAAVHDLANGASRQLWEVRLLWNGGRREEIDGLFWADDVDAVNKRAISLWPQLASSVPCGGMSAMSCQENVDGSRTRKGIPYQGFACLGMGQASVMITVSQVVSASARRYGAQLVKRALASRGLSKAGSREEQARRLADYILYPAEDDDLLTAWRCTQQQGVDIRLEISLDAPCHPSQGPGIDDVVKASEERVGSGGARFLRLADGRGWLPTRDAHGQVLFNRENPKSIHLKVEQLGEWSEARLLSAMRSKDLRPWLMVEAYVEGANGERREIVSFTQCPPWQVRVDDMAFPLTLTFIERSCSEAAGRTSMSPSEAAATPMKDPPANENAASGQKLSRIVAPGDGIEEAAFHSKRRRLRKKTAAASTMQPKLS